jgi:GrpB-like predicted nucleotidyltransferase (UPF0157 family)
MSEGAKETGLIGGVEKRTIEIMDYEPLWRDKFQAHANAIDKALGEAALRVEHIGSTAVPRLAAKPIVDILVVVGDSAREELYLPQIEAAGYELRVREPGFHEHRMFRTTTRDVHVHFYSPDSPEIGRNLIFRDRLRNNNEARRTYEDVKRKLATQSWADMNAYADAKSEVIERIIADARESSERPD